MKRKGDLLWLSFSALVGGSTSPASTVAPEKWKEQWDSGKARNEGHTYWQIMQISNAINSDVTQRASEQTTAASVLWNFITTLFTCVNAFCMQLKSYFWESHFSMFSEDYFFTQCWIMHIPSWNHFYLPSQAQLHWNVSSVWTVPWCSSCTILIRMCLSTSTN